jgi:hypothetical protein
MSESYKDLGDMSIVFKARTKFGADNKQDALDYLKTTWRRKRE